MQINYARLTIPFVMVILSKVQSVLKIVSRHGKTGQNFLTRPEKYPTRTRFFFTRSKNGLTRDPTRVFCGSTRPDPNLNHFF